MTSGRSALGPGPSKHPAPTLRRALDLLRHRSARFALVGVVATLVHGATLGLLAGPAHLSPVVANTAALFAAAAFSYFGHRSFTFRSTTRHAQSVAKFSAQFAGSWVVTSAIAITLIPRLGSWPVSLLIVVLVPCLNYLLYARWTFR